MKSETFWPQQKLYLFAICAFFPERIEGVPLDVNQMDIYVKHFFSVNEQIEALKDYEAKGMFDLEFQEFEDDKCQFTILNINHEQCTSKLKEYLEKFHNNELIAGSVSTVKDYDVLQGCLYDYLKKSSRDNPIVKPFNIWQNWSEWSSSEYPFWEVILSSQLISEDTQVVDMSLIEGGVEMPQAIFKIVNKQILLSDDGDNASGRYGVEIMIDDSTYKNLYVKLKIETGEELFLKNDGKGMRNGMAPNNLLKHLLSHPGEEIDIEYARKHIAGCEDIKNMGERLRQCGFNEDAKSLLFDISSKTNVCLKRNIFLNRSEIALLKK